MEVLANMFKTYVPELEEFDSSTMNRVAKELTACPTFVSQVAPRIPIAASAITGKVKKSEDLVAEVNNNTNAKMNALQQALDQYERNVGPLPRSRVWMPTAQDAAAPNAAVPVAASNVGEKKRRIMPPWLAEAVMPYENVYLPNKMYTGDRKSVV